VALELRPFGSVAISVEAYRWTELHSRWKREIAMKRGTKFASPPRADRSRPAIYGPSRAPSQFRSGVSDKRAAK